MVYIYYKIIDQSSKCAMLELRPQALDVWSPGGSTGKRAWGSRRRVPELKLKLPCSQVSK